MAEVQARGEERREGEESESEDEDFNPPLGLCHKNLNKN